MSAMNRLLAFIFVFAVVFQSAAAWYWPFGSDEESKAAPRISELMEPASLVIDEASDLAAEGKLQEAVEKYRKALAELDRIELENPDRADKPEFATLRNKRLNFGLVFQSFNLFPQYTVLDNVTLAPKMLLVDKIKQYKKQLKQEKLGFVAINQKLAQYKANQLDKITQEAVQLLQKTGLLDKKDAYPCQLSGGQCQRVAIARALALKPKILCFDEPTSALDPELTGEVLRVIRSLKDEGCTMLIVTHEMEFAKNVSDSVIFMSDGIVEECGLPSQIFTNPTSEKLKTFLHGLSNKD